MTGKSTSWRLLCGGSAVLFLLAGNARADDAAATQQQLQLLQEQNEKLQQQLQKQQELIDSLSRKVSEIQNASSNRDAAITDLKTEMKDQSDQTPAGCLPAFRQGAYFRRRRHRIF